MSSQLNQAQEKAVKSIAKVILCLAGAGTGKTKTLTERIAHLQSERISCSKMLALTFTRLAGKEMKERIIKLVGEAEGKNLFCNTFHAFCVKLLKEWGYLIGYNKDFTIYDQEDKENIIQIIIKEMKYRAHPDEVIEYLNNTFSSKATNYSDVKGAADEYKNRLLRNNAIDLDGLLIYTLELLTKYPKVQQYVHDQYEYMFVDEFQDSNDIQMQLIKVINPVNLFVVGDDFQSIYGWRQAKPEYIINFEKYYPGCEVIKLQDNYRSTVPIIEAANNLIAHNENQTKKILISHKEGAEIEYFEAETVDNEVNLVASKILEDKEHYSDFAVLTRTNKQMDPFIEKFKMFHIPYQLVSSKEDPLKKMDIRMALNLLEVILNPKDDMTVKKIINFPKKMINELKLQQIEKEQTDKNITFMETLKNVPEAQSFLEMYERLHQKVFEECYMAEDAFIAVLQELNLKEKYESEGRLSKMDDLDEAHKAICRWQDVQYKLGETTEFSAFLKWMHIKDIQEKLMEEKDAVKIMTVHASKGLEFKNVFVIGMNRNIFPSKRGNLEEERRLFYVAITRAKENLYISRSKVILGWADREIPAEESPFIKELELN